MSDRTAPPLQNDRAPAAPATMPETAPVVSVKQAIRHLNQTSPWDSHRQDLEVVMVLPETPTTKTFCFQTTDQSWFRYLPGQFITVELPIDGTKVLRTYTISSSPSRPLSLAITVKAQPNSYASKWMHDNLKEGDRIKAYGPAGIFSLHHHLADKYLFISAGSGITPMMSMLRWLYDRGRHTDVTFIHCAQRPSEIIFRAEIERMVSRVNDINVGWIVDEPDPHDAWTGYRGRLNQLSFELIASDYMEREIFCCGPAPFMQAVRDILNIAGFDMARYHEESFQEPIRTEADVPVYDEVVPDEAEWAELVFAESGRSVRCRQSDTILAAAREAGIVIPSACQFGVCGTCKVRKTEGDVYMVHNGGISDDDIADGYILACCSNPMGRVAIEA